jgi:hypothetical protein
MFGAIFHLIHASLVVNLILLFWNFIIQGTDKAISQMVADALSIERIKAEIAKYEVLCSNCHRRITAKNQEWFRK